MVRCKRFARAVLKLNRPELPENRGRSYEYHIGRAFGEVAESRCRGRPFIATTPKAQAAREGRPVRKTVGNRPAPPFAAFRPTGSRMESKI